MAQHCRLHAADDATSPLRHAMPTTEPFVDRAIYRRHTSCSQHTEAQQPHHRAWSLRA